MQCRDVDLVCADVEKWKWPRQDLVMYVFLDFSERAMMNLYARFNRHVQDGHRLYLVMIDRTGRMPLNESPYFAEIEQPAEIARMVRWFSPYDFQVYQSHEPETEIIWDKHRKPRRRARS